MLRVLFNTLSLFSLVLAIVFSGFWVRGQFAADFIRCDKNNDVMLLGVTRSGVMFLYLEGFGLIMGSPAGGGSQWSVDTAEPAGVNDGPGLIDDEKSQINFLDLVVHIGTPPFGGSAQLVVLHVPFWLLLLLTMVLPMVRFVRWRRAGRARRRLGLCMQCGYDLRGTSAGAACPECGTARAASA